jgi:penicillin-binding protein 1A
MKSLIRIPVAICTWLAAMVLTVAALFVGAYYYVSPGLPKAEELRDVRMEVPLSVYSRDGRLIAQFGEAIRTPARLENIPPVMINAVLAAEDEYFFEHPGVDYRGITRAVLNVLRTMGDRSIGGSTITQQVARQYFLSPERLYIRKFKEWILALRLEQEFTKEEILELYLNTTFFGQRSYGVVTAAQTYFGKSLDELTVAEAALIAGIAQGPSIQNPVRSPERAAARRAYVLRRMNELGMISDEEHRTAAATPVVSRLHARRIELEAHYIAEMVRLEMTERYGDAALTSGFRVTTTIDSTQQRAAADSVRQALLNYDERHGYRGPLLQLELPQWVADTDAAELAERPEMLADLELMLADFPNRVGMTTALVLSVEDTEAAVYMSGRGPQILPFDAVSWAARYIDDNRVSNRPRTMGEVLTPGDVVRFRVTDNGNFRLAQIPDVQGALVAMDPQDGGITALVGGFDYFISNYNRATQSRRQPGSAFKPFIYSAALENGFTPATMINDAPLSEHNPATGATWRPQNYSGSVYGEISFRDALVRSLNLASVRIARDTGISNTTRHLRAFGFDDAAVTPDLTVSLGAGGISPLELARGYAMLANGGYHIEPYVIDRIESAEGEVLYQASPAIVCPACEDSPLYAGALPPGEEYFAAAEETTKFLPLAPRAITAQNAYLINDILQDVIRRGTGTRALQLGRRDLAGKTGTTNGFTDAWFGGYNRDVVATVWVGFDDFSRSLGRAGGAAEEGSRTALPMWITFMAEALAGVPENPFVQPPGIVEARINPRTGLIASDAATDTRLEKFQIGRLPDRERAPAFTPPGSSGGSQPPSRSVDPLF